MTENSNNDKILTKNDFSLMVEEKAIEDGISCLEVINLLIDDGKVSVDCVPGLLSPRLVSKIEAEARKLNLLKKTSSGSVKSLVS